MIDDDRTIGPYTAGSDILQPDAVLASQFFDSLRGPARPEGERRLLVAMLEDAVRCFQQHRAAPTRQKRVLYTQAKQWITSRDESWIFSFDNVCGALGIDPEWLRRRLLAWEQAQPRADALAAESPSAAGADEARETVPRTTAAAGPGVCDLDRRRSARSRRGRCAGEVDRDRPALQLLGCGVPRTLL